MDDDFNTPEAQAILFEVAHEINKQKDPQQASQRAATLKYLGSILGLLQQPADQFLQGEADGEGPAAEEIEALIRQRSDARRNKDWAESDRIRDLLVEQGIILEDGAEGTTWRRG
jgi:cysteinyl-tRNA synthetase